MSHRWVSTKDVFRSEKIECDSSYVSLEDPLKGFSVEFSHEKLLSCIRIEFTFATYFVCEPVRYIVAWKHRMKYFWNKFNDMNGPLYTKQFTKEDRSIFETIYNVNNDLVHPTLSRPKRPPFNINSPVKININCAKLSPIYRMSYAKGDSEFGDFFLPSSASCTGFSTFKQRWNNEKKSNYK